MPLLAWVSATIRQERQTSNTLARRVRTAAAGAAARRGQAGGRARRAATLLNGHKTSEYLL